MKMQVGIEQTAEAVDEDDGTVVCVDVLCAVRFGHPSHCFCSRLTGTGTSLSFTLSDRFPERATTAVGRSGCSLN